MEIPNWRLILGWMVKLVALTIAAWWLAHWLRKLGTLLRRLRKVVESWPEGGVSLSPTLRFLARLLRRWWLKS